MGHGPQMRPLGIRLVGGQVRIVSAASRKSRAPLNALITACVSRDSSASFTVSAARGILAEMSSAAGTAFMYSRSSFE